METHVIKTMSEADGDFDAEESENDENFCEERRCCGFYCCKVYFEEHICFDDPTEYC